MPDREPRVDRSGEEIVAEIFIAGTAEEVWHEITKRDEAQGSFFNAWLTAHKLAPGEPMAMRDRTGAYTSVVGQILEFDPPRRFSHTFRFTQYDDAPCKVVYEIEEVEGGVLFRLTVADVPPTSKTEKSMFAGAKIILTSLRRIVERGRLAPGLGIAVASMECLAPVLLPSRCRSEYWPLPGIEEPSRSSSMRLLTAVLAPWVLWGLLDSAIAMALVGLAPDAFDAGGFPRASAMLIAILTLRAVYSVTAGYTTARIARDRTVAIPIEAGLLLATGVLVQVLTWSHYPTWFGILFLISIVPCAILGSALAFVRGSPKRPGELDQEPRGLTTVDDLQGHTR